MEQYRILGSKVTAITIPELHDRMKAVIREGGKELVLNVNVHGVNLARRHPWLKAFRNQAGIVHCDGAGIMLGLRILGARLPCRITVHDWMWDLAPFCVENRFSIYFLGGRPGIAQLAAERVRARHPGLSLAGAHHGYFAKSGAESEAVLREINALRPDILVVGFGMPVQERWIMEHWERVDARIFIAGGGVFDVLSGALRTWPGWVGAHGLEWLCRFLMEPRRLFARYIIGNPVFLCNVIFERLGWLKEGRD